MTDAHTRARRGLAAVGLATCFTLAASSTASAWAPGRFMNCNWRYKQLSSPELTLRYRLEPGVPSEVLRGIRDWDRLDRIKLVRDDAYWDFQIRMVKANSQGHLGETSRTDGYPFCSSGSPDLPAHKMQISIETKLSTYPALTQFKVGAHEMGHVLGFQHWNETAGSGTFSYYTSIMTSTTDHARMPGFPTSLDVKDVSDMYTPQK